MSAETDIAWSGIKGTLPADLVFEPGGAPVLTPLACVPNCEVASPWLATARLRLGYSFDWIMPYVTAGVAVARLEASIAGIPLGRQSANNLGWLIGAGAEIVIAGPWTAKLEFLHADLNGFSCDVACPIPVASAAPIFSTGVSINAAENIIRLGLNYRIWNH